MLDRGRSSEPLRSNHVVSIRFRWHEMATAMSQKRKNSTRVMYGIYSCYSNIAKLLISPPKRAWGEKTVSHIIGTITIV